MKYSSLTSDVQNKLKNEFLKEYDKKNPLYSIVYPIILVLILIGAILGVCFSDKGFFKVVIIILGIGIDSFICNELVIKYKKYKVNEDIDYNKWLKVRNINK